jgi:hypothetical protein
MRQTHPNRWKCQIRACSPTLQIGPGIEAIEAIEALAFILAALSFISLQKSSTWCIRVYKSSENVNMCLP